MMNSRQQIVWGGAASIRAGGYQLLWLELPSGPRDVPPQEPNTPTAPRSQPDSEPPSPSLPRRHDSRVASGVGDGTDRNVRPRLQDAMGSTPWDIEGLRPPSETSGRIVRSGEDQAPPPPGGWSAAGTAGSDRAWPWWSTCLALVVWVICGNERIEPHPYA